MLELILQVRLNNKKIDDKRNLVADHWSAPDAYHVGNTADMSVDSCGNMDPITGYSGNLTVVTNINGTYANNLQCTWTIRVPVGMIVQVRKKFVLFQ